MRVLQLSGAQQKHLTLRLVQEQTENVNDCDLDDAYCNAAHIPGFAGFSPAPGPRRLRGPAQGLLEQGLQIWTCPMAIVPRQAFDLFHPQQRKGLMVFVHWGLLGLRFDKKPLGASAAGRLSQVGAWPCRPMICGPTVRIAGYHAADRRAAVTAAGLWSQARSFSGTFLRWSFVRPLWLDRGLLPDAFSRPYPACSCRSRL